MRALDARKNPQVRKCCKRILIVIFFSVLYSLMGNFSVTKIAHPFLEDGIIAFNMIIIVIAGIIFGSRTGFSVGILSGIVSVLLQMIFAPADNYLYDLYAIIPHGIMGFAAGKVYQSSNLFLASTTIIVGHTLNMIVFTVVGLFALGDFNQVFWINISYETIIDIIAINIVCNLLLISFPFIKNKW